ncbi:MAG TPA: hypothetical protein VGP82_13325 [Ktedonobacterales bacterium]|nr:hypothetical protein [Ktedonobacterales bacterium]
MAVGTAYLERYLAGEHERVWAELQALGEGVREPPLYPDALAVARETMRRARHNIERLIPHLEAIGYQFGYAWAVSANPQAGHQHTVAWRGPFLPPPPDTSMRLHELQTRVGPLPLSILAWFETIGEVDFVGRPPRHWGLAGSDEFDVDGEDVAASSVPPRLLDEGPTLEWCSLDPLCSWPLDAVMAMADPAAAEPDPADPDSGKGYLPLTPDPEGKYFISGGGPIGIDVPNATADAEFVDLLPFVEYLRVCFRWAGFLGLRDYLGPMGAIGEDLSGLTRDLWPL